MYVLIVFAAVIHYFSHRQSKVRTPIFKFVLDLLRQINVQGLGDISELPNTCKQLGFFQAQHSD